MIVFKAHKNKGFTLIESLIALLIISIALSSLIGSYEQNTRYFTYAKDKILSQIFINNLVVERRQVKQELGRRADSVEFANKTWYWRSIVKKFQINNILQIQLYVYASKKDRDNQRPIQSQKFYVQK